MVQNKVLIVDFLFSFEKTSTPCKKFSN